MNRNWGKAVTAVLCALIISVIPFMHAAAALFAFETQFEYEKADIAWLTDLIFKEDMSSVDGLAQRCELTVKPEYPYTDTPESFRQDVDYYCSLYDLDLGNQRAAYIYFFDVLGSQAGGLMAGEISDDDIRIYLESVGIDYPESPDSDELVVARALYGAMVSGAFSGITSGSSLEEVIVTYLATLTGVNTEELEEWIPEDSVLSLDSYITAASKLALWTNGYDVSVDTDDDEVFRLLALMTTEKIGISADGSLSLNALKFKYMATLLGEKYGVDVDSEKLMEAIENDSAAFYILSLIGRDAGLAIREDNCSFEEAFELVAENTGIFDIESDEFYADIFNYDLHLKYRRSSLWIYPTAYASDDDYTVSIDVDGTPVRNSYYTQIPIDPDRAEQTLAVSVYVDSESRSSKCVYYITVYQGGSEYKQPDPVIPSHGVIVDPFISSESLVAQIMATIGSAPPAPSILPNSVISFPAPILGMLSYITPTFENIETTGNLKNENVLSDDGFKAVLDEMGSLSDFAIKGIDGMTLVAGDETFNIRDFITFE